MPVPDGFQDSLGRHMLLEKMAKVPSNNLIVNAFVDVADANAVKECTRAGQALHKHKIMRVIEQDERGQTYRIL